ncbi:hypothetical protein ACQ94O_23715, partial [Escherichia coli]
TVCVVGKIRDLILQLSKSSIYSTKPVDLQKDILDKMDFTPVISPELKLMDERLFIDAAMGFVLPEAAH